MLDKKQQQAIEMILQNRISIVNGQAGTGKSYTVLQAQTKLEQYGWIINKIAPTGKAALRIGGATIDRWMEPNCQELQNGKIIWGSSWGEKDYKKELIDNKTAVFIDESSMIDGEKMLEILRIINNSSNNEIKVVFIGDTGQLEPIGDGIPFIDFVEQGYYPITTLDTIHRSSEGSDLIDFADLVRNRTVIKVRHDLYSLPTQDYKSIIDVNDKQALEIALQDLNNNQIICAKRSDDFGTNWWNYNIQTILFHNKEKKLLVKQIKWDDDQHRYINTGVNIYKGDKIIITKNNAVWEVVNGLMGYAVDRRIVDFPTPSGVRKIDCLIIDVDGKEIPVNASWVNKNIDLAYAISIHKAQGSEWDNVIVPILEEQGSFPQWKGWNGNKTFYTAITRAKNNVYLLKTRYIKPEDQTKNQIEDDFDWSF